MKALNFKKIVGKKESYSVISDSGKKLGVVCKKGTKWFVEGKDFGFNDRLVAARVLAFESGSLGLIVGKSVSLRKKEKAAAKGKITRRTRKTKVKRNRHDDTMSSDGWNVSEDEFQDMLFDEDN